MGKVKKLIALLSTLALLAGCAAEEVSEPVEEATESPSSNTEITTWWPGVADCDSEEIDTFEAEDGVIREATCRTDGQLIATPALAQSTQTSSPAMCEIEDVSPERIQFGDTAMIVGFPRKSHNIDPIGSPKISAVPVQFPDLSGSAAQLRGHREQLEKFASYYREVSHGKLNFEVDMLDEWLTMPAEQSEYSVTAAEYRDSYGDRIVAMREKWMKDGVALADPYMDFTGTDIIVFLLPDRQKALDLTLQAFYGGDLRYKGQSDEGEIRNLFVIGMPETPMRMYWAYYAHETGHTLSLPDWYSFNFGDTDESGNTIGPMSTFEMMSSNWGPSLTMSAWSRWLMGWLETDEFFCGDRETFEDASFVLDDIDSGPGTFKSVMLRTSDTTALIVESRREQPFDEGPTSRSRGGVIVYEIDTTLSHGQGALRLVMPEGRGLIYSYPGAGGEPSLDAVLYQGNSVEHSGFRVTVNEIAEFDTVSIQRIGG